MVTKEVFIAFFHSERIGEAVEVVMEARSSRSDVTEPAAGVGAGWRAGAAPALLAGALAALLAALAGMCN